MWTTWWAWIAAGFVLGILEIVAPGYIFLGFAVGAVITGALLGIGLLGGNIPLLLLIFALSSLLGWYVLRRIFGQPQHSVVKWDRDVNDNK